MRPACTAASCARVASSRMSSEMAMASDRIASVKPAYVPWGGKAQEKAGPEGPAIAERDGAERRYWQFWIAFNAAVTPDSEYS